MALILTIDPDRKQGAALERLRLELDDHEILLATSCVEALEVVDRRVPDLVLLPLIVSPGDERQLRAGLQARSGAGSVRMLTLPLLTDAHERPGQSPLGLLEAGRARPGDGESAGGCAARVFADLVRAHLGSPDPSPSTSNDAVQAHRARVRAAASAAVTWARTRRTTWTPSTEAVTLQNEVPRAVAQSDRPAAPPAVVTAPSVAVAAPPVTVAAPLVITTTAESRRPQAPQAMTASTATDLARAGAVEAIEPAIEIVETPVPHFDFSSGWQSAESGKGHGPSTTARISDLAALVAPPVLRWLPRLVAAAAIVGACAWGITHWPKAAAPTTGFAVLESVPNGSRVVVDGKAMGMTPTTLELPAGSHVVKFEFRDVTRTMRLSVSAGGRRVARVDWMLRPIGRLKITSEPAGARVLIDGVDRGVTPLVMEEIAVGEYALELVSAKGSIRRSVTVEANQTTQVEELIFAGWLKVFSPFDVTITESARELRLDDRGQVMLAPGSHELRFESRAFGYIETRRVELRPGEVTSLSLVPPRSTITVTATAMAEVWLDGVSVGSTPLVDLPVELGTHDLVLKREGEDDRRLAVTVTAKPLGVAVDFSKPAS